MASPQRRPRGKGGTERNNLTAKGFELSNSTMTKFLGGTQKSWMTGHHIVKDKSLSTVNSARPKKSTQGEESSVSIQPEIGRNHSNAIHDPKFTMSPNTLTAVNTVNTFNAPFALAKQTQQEIETVLSSPAPSDEHRQEIIHIINLEQEEDQPILANHQHNSPGNPSELRLTSQTDEHTGIERHGRKLQDIESREEMPDIINRNSLSSVHADPSRPAAIKRNLEFENDSRKRTQVSNRSASESTPRESLPNSNQIEERSLSGLTTRVPSDTTVESFLSQITDRLNFVNGAQDRRGREIEVPRLGLLQDACNRRDYFYLVVHQLFCMESTLSMSNQSLSSSIASEHSGGLKILNDLLLSNDQMENQAVLWFSDFPLSLEVLLQSWPGLKPSHEKAVECLHKLPQNWMQVREHCRRRCYPPLVDEMSSVLGVASLVLQRVISRAILRDIWPGSHDECYLEGERLFHRNQQAVQLRESPLDTATILSYNTQLANEYQRLLSRHQQHIRTPDQRSNFSQQRRNTAPNISTLMPPPQPIPASMSSATGPSVPRNASPSIHSLSNPSTAILAYINTRSNPHSPVGFVSTPTLPSSPFSNTQTSPVTAAESSTPRYFSPTYVQLSAPPQQRRPRGRPRRDLEPVIASGTNDLEVLASDQNSALNFQWQGNPQPQRATANVPSQPLISPWSDQSNMSIGHAHVRQSVQSSNGMPSTPSLRNTFRVHVGHQGVSQQPSATFPLQRQGPAQSPSISSNPQSSTSPYRLQPGVYQVQPQYTQAQSPTSHQLLPPLSQIRSHTEPPNPISNTLHQVQARSPTLASTDMSGKVDSTIKLFAFVRRLVVIPNRLNTEKRHFKWTFATSKEDYDVLAKDLETNNGAPPTRLVRNGSCYSRIRCVRVPKTGESTEGDWVIADTIWPNGVAILINGTALEIRKKIHHGKDLPVDITKYVKEGENVLSVATIRPKQDDQASYAITMETIQIADSTAIRNEISKLELADALKRILEHSGSTDPDVQVVDTAIILDLTDPYTSHIFDKPVRGQACRHSQCFDLEVFLQTRSRKSSSHPSPPEHFKCPICRADARPQSLIMDLFFVSVRKELELMHRLDVKAIVLDEHGNWNIKEEEQTGESEDSSRKQQSNVRDAKALERRESEVIELDDD